MQSRQEKIAFLYPTLILEGSAASGILPPTLILYGIDFSKLYSFYITAGLLFLDEHMYMTSADVFYDGKSVLKVDKNEESSMNVPLYGTPIPNQTALISSMYMRGVALEKPGIYTFELELFRYKSDGKEKDLVEKKSCSLIVAEHKDGD
ncbi:hypothetical protein [Serratia sp. CY83965]|uniref:hypothetical protein n=1 Tax=Serratia sp. CY83965 TaxID=3383693 RepID=UPI003FA166B5